MTGTAAWSVEPAALGARVERIWNRVTDAGGDPTEVSLVAVTKGFGADVAVAAVAAGLVDLGENYAQELMAKAAVLATENPDARWHAIGRLQRNKVRSIAATVVLWQSIDRVSLGAEVARRAPGAEVLVQVNVSDEAQKGGCPPDSAAELVARLVDEGLVVRGLMTVGRTGTPAEARTGFARLGLLADHLDLPVRSMGMTADFEAAVAEGATMIRIGHALFGPRPSREPA